MIKTRNSLTLLLFVILLLVPTGPVAAEDKEWSLGFDAPTNSKYLWRGINLVDDFVFQPSVTFGYQGLTLALWGNMELTDVNDYGAGFGSGSGKFTEVDMTVDYSWSHDAFGFSVGLINYRFPNTPYDATTELYAAVSFDMPLAPTLTLFQDIDQADSSYINLAVGHSVGELWSGDGISASLDVGAWVSLGSSNYHQYYFGVDGFSLADAAFSVALPIAINGSVTLTPTFNVTTLLDGDVRDAVDKPDNVWFGIGITVEL